MEKKKNTGKVFKWILFGFFLIFLTLYLSQATGYYEFEQYRKVSLTEEKIKEFEEDIKRGKKIDIKNYFDDTDISYNNNVSKAGLNISQAIEKNFDKGMKYIFKFLEKMFSN